MERDAGHAKGWSIIRESFNIHICILRAKITGRLACLGFSLKAKICAVDSWRRDHICEWFSFRTTVRSPLLPGFSSPPSPGAVGFPCNEQSVLLLPAAKAITWFLYECPHRPPGLRCFCVLSFLFCLYTKLVETHLFQRLVVIPISLFRMIAYFSELMGEHTCNNFHSRSLDTRSYYRWEVNPGLMRFRSS